MCILQIAISTINDGIFKIKYHEKCNYLVVHQITNGSDYSFLIKSLPSNVIYKAEFKSGLSLSRNVALKYSTATYVWLMDDDVDIDICALDLLLDLLSDNPADIVLVNYSIGGKVKRIPSEINSLFSLPPFSSINIIVNRNILKKGLFFDERFGLGTSLPSGEEFVFLSDAYKLGASFHVVNQVFSRHPPVTSGQDFYSSDMKICAKIEMFKRVFGQYRGVIYSFLFFVKKIPILYKNKSTLKFFKKIWF